LGLPLLLVLLLLGSAGSTAALAPDDYVYTPWYTIEDAPFQFTRFDAEFSQLTGRVYFLGGRLADGNTDGSVWMYNPVAKTYSDTGIDMPVPVSNYTIARVTDAVGDEVLLIVGGRAAAGTTTTAVQGFKPGSNIAVDYTATDPYPVSTSPGSVEVVDNIAYIFGGFDSAAVIADTYLFDITAAAGSRFSTGPDLNLARSYLASAVVDGKIYAIGGDTFDGAALIAQTMVEVLDTADPTPAWDDAAAADLPFPCDENRAFGFNTLSPFDYRGTVVVAGCGQWTAEFAWSLLYDPATDTWDETFPDLNEARRNHAAAFVPEGEGAIGMYVWGGRQESDATVLATPEVNIVTPLGELTVIPDYQLVEGFGTVSLNQGVFNYTDATTINLSYEDTEGWALSGPASLEVPYDDIVAFTLEVEVPLDATCGTVNTITVTAEAEGLPTSDQGISEVEAFCPTGLAGTITDANTDLPIEHAYVYLEEIGNSANTYEGYTDEDGVYFLVDVIPGDYYFYASANGYEWSVGDDGWPAGADEITILDLQLLQHNVSLEAPMMALSTDSLALTLDPGEVQTVTLTISNDGTADLEFALNSTLAATLPPGPVGRSDWRPAERIDPRIIAEMELSPQGTADFIAVMEEQADLSAAYGMDDWAARGQFVYDRLAATAERTQAGLRAQLAAAGAEVRVFLAANALLVKDGSPAMLELAAGRPEVAYVLANDEIALETQRPSLLGSIGAAMRRLLDPSAVEWGVERVNAPDVWSAYGNTGEGIVVANVDTGVEWSHPALESQYRGGPGDHDYNWYHPTSPDGCDGSAEPCDNAGHGSHTMGTMVGDDGGANQIGVAPGATWMACKGCESNSCSFEALLACGDWITAPTDLTGANPDPSRRPNVVNNSWGGGSGDYWYASVVSAWRAAGIFPQFSNGNNGPSCETAGSPGDYWMSFAAGATDSTDAIAFFSSRGPSLNWAYPKPNLSAPGVDVRSSVPGGGYALSSGTSMAAPHSAGVAALLWATHPELIGQIEPTIWLMQQSADPQTSGESCGGVPGTEVPNNTFGWGIVDALAAAELADQGGFMPDWLAISPLSGTLAPGESMDITIVVTAPDDLGLYEAVIQVTADEPYNRFVQIPVTLAVGEQLTTLYLPLARLDD
jgi:subtilisin family serine protease